MKINELSKVTGIPISTLRFYEKKKLLLPKYLSRDENNHRIYSKSVINHLHDVQLLLAIGFTINEVKDLYENSQTLTKKERMSILNKKKKVIQQKMEQLKESEEILTLLLHDDNSSILEKSNWKC
ncbi:hypothetical protein CHH55_06740 [Niallia circulans]|jgi:DNA-binding transcriptional MerR regulator|uniref:MerR family transcriptional regulator n=1 Tax=Niallia circulans TaxID=1397 RepID=UPI000BA76CFE|nr:MerR family transcriptional regulator [Niallia circulans]PAD26666.1 hypothetical protein CHH62_05900 [Niallia circulans]PAD88686.1 hypothetical protein CHH55_06740 [Niallia circulans]